MGSQLPISREMPEEDLTDRKMGRKQEEFLDRAISRGDGIILSFPAPRLNDESTFYKGGVFGNANRTTIYQGACKPDRDC